MELLKRHASARYLLAFVTALQDKSVTAVTVESTLAALSECRDSYTAISDDAERAAGLELVCYAVNSLQHCSKSGLCAAAVLNRW
jgi:hypothetical protein